MNKIRFAILGLAALAAVSCMNKEFEEITTVPLKRCLEPMNLSAKVDANSGVQTTFKWDVTSDAEQYILEVLTEDGKSVLYDTLAPAQVPFVTELEADGVYTFNVRGISSKLDDSNLAEYGETFKTYAIKDNLYLALTGKTSESVSLSWSKEVSDYMDVSHIEAKPVSGGKAVTLDIENNEAVKTAAAATLTGLTPSTEYNIVLYFKSASRGALTVWTSPAPGTLTKVTTSDALKAAMTAGDDVYVGAEGSPYSVGSITPAKGFRMLGEPDASGNAPVVSADLVLDAGFTGDLYFENISFDGTGRDRIINHKGGEMQIGKISIVNCVIANYNAGIYYDNSGDKLDLGEFLIEGCDIHDILGSGGDGFDVRNNSAISKITFRNNTVFDSFRSFFRIDDKSTSLEEIVFENNTVKNIAVNDKGIFYIRAPWKKFTINKNLFMFQQGEKAVIATTNNVDNVPSDITAADNYYYNVGEKFFGESKNFTAAQISAKALAADPCFNSKGNFFNLANEELQDKKVGAAKWLNAYVEPKEDLTLGLTEAPHTWDLTDATLFAADLTKSKVRDGLLMVASEACPMNLDGAISFMAASAKNKKGVPTDGYIAFKVNTPGSVVLKVDDPKALGSQVVVATGDVDGAAATIKGGAVANADGSLQKVVLNGIKGETMVYLYVTGAAKISTLAWSPDTAGVNTSLEAPKPAISVETITKGDATEIVVSWAAVPNAASYTVTFNKAKTTTEDTSFVIDAETAAGLDAGSYTVSVVANPADTDIYNTASEAGVAAFAVLAAGGGEDTVEVTLTWDFSSSEWQAELGRLGASGSDITGIDMTYDGLTFYSSSKSKYGASYIQFGGAGLNKTSGELDRYFKFTAPAGGTLKVTASNTGSSEDLTRMVYTKVGDNVQQLPGGYSSTAAQAVEFEVPAGEVYISSAGNGLRFYKMEFTYTTTSGGSGKTPVEYDWNFSSAEWQSELGRLGASGSDITSINMTYDGLTFYSNPKSKYGSNYIQFGGAGLNKTSGELDRYFMFTAPEAGTLKVTASNTGSSEDLTRMVYVKVGDNVQQLPGGYSSTAAQAVEFEVPAGEVYIASAGNGLRFYEIYYTNQ
ncbi:MAG: DUF4957 domain-containing protein [Bacteroidales bacterium]|nr:DUF4957 domain-containing protein [Bacteroidales bacterium]